MNHPTKIPSQYLACFKINIYSSPYDATTNDKSKAVIKVLIKFIYSFQRKDLLLFL
jgi:hypothetical protein